MPIILVTEGKRRKNGRGEGVFGRFYKEFLKLLSICLFNVGQGWTSAQAKWASWANSRLADLVARAANIASACLLFLTGKKAMFHKEPRQQGAALSTDVHTYHIETVRHFFHLLSCSCRHSFVILMLWLLVVKQSAVNAKTLGCKTLQGFVLIWKFLSHVLYTYRYFEFSSGNLIFKKGIISIPHVGLFLFYQVAQRV